MTSLCFPCKKKVKARAYWGTRVACGLDSSFLERFSYFSHIFHQVNFCRMCYFNFLNSILIKNLEMNSSFLEFFISNF
jgi:hypothetical protein